MLPVWRVTNNRHLLLNLVRTAQEKNKKSSCCSPTGESKPGTFYQPEKAHLRGLHKSDAIRVHSRIKAGKELNEEVVKSCLVGIEDDQDISVIDRFTLRPDLSQRSVQIAALLVQSVVFRFPD